MFLSMLSVMVSVVERVVRQDDILFRWWWWWWWVFSVEAPVVTAVPLTFTCSAVLLRKERVS